MSPVERGSNLSHNSGIAGASARRPPSRRPPLQLLSATSSLNFCLMFFQANCPLICLNRISILTCRKRRFQVGVQSLSKTSSLAPGVRQLRPVIYYYEFRRRRSHTPSVFGPKVTRFYFTSATTWSPLSHNLCLMFSPVSFKPQSLPHVLQASLHTLYASSLSPLPTATSVASRSAYKASVKRRH